MTSTAMITTTNTARGRTDTARQPTQDQSARSTARFGGITAIVGAGLMIGGAVVQQTSGADVFGAMQSTDAVDIGRHLTEVAGAQTQIIVGLALWIAGVSGMAAGGLLLARLGSRSPWSTLAQGALAASTGAAVVFFSLMMGVAAGLAPAHVAGDDVLGVTRAVGFAAATADWVVTALILGVGMVAAVWAGRQVWAPRWLLRFGLVSALAAGLSLIAYVAGNDGLAFIDVPVGLGFVMATGIAAFRHGS